MIEVFVVVSFALNFILATLFLRARRTVADAKRAVVADPQIRRAKTREALLDVVRR